MAARRSYKLTPAAVADLEEIRSPSEYRRWQAFVNAPAMRVAALALGAIRSDAEPLTPPQVPGAQLLVPAQ